MRKGGEAEENFSRDPRANSEVVGVWTGPDLDRGPTDSGKPAERNCRSGGSGEPKALEALNKLDEQERRRNERIEVADYAEELYQLARALPQSGLGALLGLSHYFQTTGHIINFPYLTEVAPIAAQRFSDDWQRWRSKHSTDEIAVLDKLAAGPLLDGDSLVSAIKAKQPRHVAVPKIEEALLEKSRENGVA
jgi:hypothetical protein